MTSPWLTRAEAAEYLRLSVDRLAYFASKGTGGPPFHKTSGSRGTCRYHKAELDAWLGEPVTSSHEAVAREKRRAEEDAAA